MTKLTAMPAQNIIDGFKGVIDFYVYMGLPCVRSWPRSPGHHRSPGVEAQWEAFAWAASHWTSLAPQVQAAYRAMASGTRLSGRDIFTKSYINGSFLIEL